jgi:iron complex transport system substrate-binding protein
MSNPPGSTHTQLIEICGGKNVVEAPLTKGSVGVSMELLLQWNPDVIITSNEEFYKKVYSDSYWANIKAVQDKQVYLVPISPFNWFEDPPGANTIIGIPWTAKVLYPDKFKDLDLKKITKEFYAEYYNYNLTDTQASRILSNSGLGE